MAELDAARRPPRPSAHRRRGPGCRRIAEAPTPREARADDGGYNRPSSRIRPQS